MAENKHEEKPTAADPVVVVADMRGADPLGGVRQVGQCKLFECLAEFTAPEHLIGINRYKCLHCAETKGNTSQPEEEQLDKPAKKGAVLCDATKQIAIKALPETLVIQIKRFCVTSRGRLQKLGDHVGIPLVLRLGQFCEPGSPAATDQQDHAYVFVGSVEHGGSLTGGHYTANVMDDDGQWYHCSDTHVAKTDLSSVLSSGSGAYLLFYQKKTLPAEQPIPTPQPALTVTPTEQPPTSSLPPLPASSETL